MTKPWKWLKSVFVLAGASALAASFLVLALTSGRGKAQTAQSESALELSPLSGGVLAALAVRSGRLQLPNSAPLQVSPEVLTCSPAPCTTPNVQASEGGSPVDETPIAANPKTASQLLSGGNDYNCASIQGFFASKDGGSTWNHTCMNSVAGQSGFGDPAVGYDTKNTAYIAGLDGVGRTPLDVVFEKSTNNGVTWSAPLIAVTPVAPYSSVDKDWLQIDDGPASPRKNSLYISTTQFDTSNNSAIVVSHSTNGGTTWTSKVVDKATWTTIDQFSDLAIGADGTVYVSWMRCSATGPTGDCGGTKASMMFSKSTDGGNTWTAPKTIASVNLVPDSCGAFYGCLPNTPERVSNIPSMDIDRSTGTYKNTIYVVMYNWTGKQMQVKVSHSKNGGTTWSAPVRVASTGKNDEFFPWLSVNSTGTVGVTWLDRRLDSANVNYDAFAATSTNGGVSFSAGVRVSTVSSNPFKDGFSGQFMGDYTGNIWVGNALFASWTDTRSGIDSQDEVGAYQVK